MPTPEEINEKIVARSIERAKNTWVFDHPDGRCFVLSHLGQPKPDMDPKSLRENFGIIGDDRRHIKLLSESSHRPLTLEERAGNRADRIKELRAELARLEAEEAVAGHPSGAPKARGRSAGVESSTAEE